jgi:hypothetical protein
MDFQIAAGHRRKDGRNLTAFFIINPRFGKENSLHQQLAITSIVWEGAQQGADS